MNPLNQTTGKSPAAEKTSASALKRKKIKKALIAAISVLIVFVILYYSITAILGALLTKPETSDPKFQYTFFDPDFDEDIMEDEEYVGLDRSFYFSDPQTGITSNSADDIPQTYRPYVETVVKYIESAIKGDNQSLNRLFSQKYYENGGEEKNEFTPQKIYNIQISFNGFSSVDENGTAYPSYTFWVEYMIRRNNGTFRNDMGSDCSKKELFRITQRNEKYQIDQITIFKTVTPADESELNCGASSVSIVSMLPIIVISALSFCRKRKSNNES